MKKEDLPKKIAVFPFDHEPLEPLPSALVFQLLSLQFPVAEESGSDVAPAAPSSLSQY